MEGPLRSPLLFSFVEHFATDSVAPGDETKGSYWRGILWCVKE